MKLLRIALSLLLVLSAIACSTQEKKTIYQTEDEVYYDGEETLAPKLVGPPLIAYNDFGAYGLFFTIITAPIWAPAITIHHFLTKPTEIDVEAKENEMEKDKGEDSSSINDYYGLGKYDGQDEDNSKKGKD